jgi:hypothetical protein
MNLSGSLDQLIRRCCTSASREWWANTVAASDGPFRRKSFDLAFTKAPRMIGPSIVQLIKGKESSPKDDVSSFEGRPIHELVRIVLLLDAASHVSDEAHIELVDELYAKGEISERIAILHALSLLPTPRRYLATAVDSCRTNIQTVFEAIACENPYPSCYFPDLNFNQLVLKAIFTDVSLHRIVGMSNRITPTLKRMVKDYVKERIAAVRVVHEDVELIMSQ